VIKILLDAGADPSATSGAAQEISFWEFISTTSSEEEEMVEMVFSNTPLHLAAQRGHAEAVSILLDAGADVLARGMRVEWDAGVSEGTAGVVDAAIYKSTAVHLAAANGHANVVEILLDAGAEVWAEDTLSFTPLLLAVRFLHRKVVQLLLAAGADVNDHFRNVCTVLFLAVGNRDPETVKILLDAGADTKFETKQGFTPLSFAVECACPNFYGESPQTPEVQRATAQAILVIRALLEGGADPTKGVSHDPTGRYAETPLHLAESRGLEEVVDILRCSMAARVAVKQAKCMAFAMGNGTPSKPEA
jgi:hypothetical protein